MYIYIGSLSEFQKEIRRDLSSKGKQVLRHLICLVLYPNSSYVLHWKDEIVSLIADVEKLKGKNKWPKKSFIKEAISTQNDMIDAVIKQVKMKERSLTPREVSESEVLKAVEIYQDWLASELSEHGIIDVYEAQDLLDSIMQSVKYQD